jgi:Glycosyl transferase family 2
VSGAALRVHIDTSAPALPGFLCMHGQRDADVPFHPGDEFPFEDRAVEIIMAGDFTDAMSRAAKLQFLLECRRTLMPGGLLRIEGRSPAQEWSPVARIAGLAPAATVPLADAARRALSELRDAHATAALEFGKADRLVAADPLVSLLIPAYNPRFFATALDSALAQTYPNTEIVVADDSRDTAIEAMVKSRAHLGPVRYARNEARLGPRGNFTRCFELAEGTFVKFLCDDDLLAPTCIARLLDGFRSVPDITLATSRRQRIDSNGQYLHDQPATLPVVARDSVIAGWSLANAMIMVGLNTIGEPSTTLFRKADLLDRDPGYFGFAGDPGHGIIDMATWAALLLQGDAVYLHECLSSFRIHAGQRQHDPAKVQRNIASIRSLQGAWLELGLHEKLPPDRLLTKPLPPPAQCAWEEQGVVGAAARRLTAGPGAAASVQA